MVEENMKIYEEDPEMVILWRICRYADYNKEFNSEFVDGVYEYWVNHCCITYKQYEILKKIYDKENVEEFTREYYKQNEEYHPEYNYGGV